MDHLSIVQEVRWENIHTKSLMTFTEFSILKTYKMNARKHMVEPQSAEYANYSRIYPDSYKLITIANQPPAWYVELS
ncbi:MAG: hypothetical protein HMLIMOIP_000319 [Candidatus Nitrosomirales archaeon]|jgi:hypothetical protein